MSKLSLLYTISKQVLIYSMSLKVPNDIEIMIFYTIVHALVIPTVMFYRIVK